MISTEQLCRDFLKLAISEGLVNPSDEWDAPDVLARTAGELVAVANLLSGEFGAFHAAGVKVGLKQAVGVLEALIAESQAAREKAVTHAYRFGLKEEIDSFNAAIERIRALMENQKGGQHVD